MILSYPRLIKILDRLLRPVEILIKKPIFGCKMCGQCVLHSTGMVCPMTCPKDIRNGPCGGVALDGSCEVYPELRCVWLTAFERSKHLLWPDEFHELRAPVDWSLKGSSSWVNNITKRDLIRSGCPEKQSSELNSAMDIIKQHAAR